MQITISDANILIDLIQLDLLAVFFSLNFDFQTTDFIVNELYPTQQQALQPFRNSGKLKVNTFSPIEMAAISTLQRSNLSFADCSGLYVAKKESAWLLTGDGNLRKTAETESITVKGILFILDAIVVANLLLPSEATNKLNELKNINNRLPAEACNQLLAKWAAMISPTP